MLVLKYYLPKAGMIYPPQACVFGRNYRDKNIRISLKQAGIIVNSPEVKRSHQMKMVDDTLAELFTLALRPDIFAKLTGQCHGSVDHLLALRDGTPWARRGWTVTWFKFFLGMVYARLKWKEYPREPFNIEQHAATAKSIDAFLDATKDLWSPVHFAFKQGVPRPKQPKKNEQSAAGEAASTIASSSPAEASEDMEFDMGNLMAALMSDTATDNIMSGIERMVIQEDDT
ncbi:hypothetical protein F4818DRAFT_454176 [Hypoxylon cercidicola]|nr:hypothetical protein F4818DRAFT_454176 [Hypoxylon cercidicola]